jgi:hypothetical protein
MEELATETKTSYLKQTLGEEYKYAEAAEAIRKIRGLQMRSFYSLEY